MRVWLIAMALLLASVSSRADEDQVRRGVQSVLQGRTIDSITKSTVPSLYEVVVDNEIFYVDGSGKHLIDGRIIELQTKRDITEERRAALLRVRLSDLPMELAIRRIVGNGERTLITFEDPNCGYCKRMAKELQGLTNVTIYTFLYPILGADSVAKAKTIWCSDDRAKTWEAWMVNGVAPQGRADCPNPIDRNLALGSTIKAAGTPLLLFKDGSRIPGAVNLHELEKRLATVEGIAPTPATAVAQRQGDANTGQPSQAATPGAAQPVQGCRPNLSFLASRIPSFTAAELRAGRQAILAENVQSAMAKAKAQGFSAQGTIKAALDQAREFDRVSRQAAECAADVDAFGATDDDFLSAMRQGRAPGSCTGIRNSCLCAGILNRMSAVAVRALAAEMQCYARSGG